MQIIIHASSDLWFTDSLEQDRETVCQLMKAKGLRVESFCQAFNNKISKVNV